ncbi:alpha/beta hydrolase [Myroides sp. DF42-4-2]|uniref:alpha/beta hydrolase n=1 Tax=Myroides sp. DF42-4-2 TaxID=2746726 RepID=UPI002578E215|nr:alpha/beta hydrolase [Myroides sp. DF42-4-2]MDM1407749.1 alpha/beta hydrolase [Myroides sp. DF42-4-2]
MIQQDIAIELMQAINESPYSQIDYDHLLVHHPEQIRIEEQQLANKEEPLDIPEGLTVENIVIPSRNAERSIRLRTYRPSNQSKLPILLYFHGGAFIYGTPEQYDFIFYPLALAVNIAIVSVDYRLAPEHPFPAALEDGYDALLWLAQEAGQLGGNKEDISLGGSSAGGTIAASLAHLVRDKQEIVIQHQYLLYPPMDHRLLTPSMQTLAHAPMQSKQAAAWMWHYYLGTHQDPPLPYAVPLLQADVSHLPPTTIIIAEADPLKDEAKQYAERLQQAGIPTTLFKVKGATHVFDFFPTTMAREFWKQQITYLKSIFIR